MFVRKYQDDPLPLPSADVRLIRHQVKSVFASYAQEHSAWSALLTMVSWGLANALKRAGVKQKHSGYKPVSLKEPLARGPAALHAAECIVETL